MKKDISFSPLYFLSSLGMGGLSVTFFIYIMFLTNHAATPIPTFNSLQGVFMSEGIFAQALIIISIVGIIYFGIQHFRLLFWNLGQLKAYKKSPAFQILKKNNTEVSLMVLPLTFAMSINVLFIFGALFIPHLWSLVEYLFPIALFAFTLVGILALHIYGDYFTRIITEGFDFAQNNNLSQMIAVMAFAMIGVGFAASAAMSNNTLTVAIAMIGTLFFTTLSIFFGILKLILGFKSMLRHGLAVEASPTFWVMIPILTLLGITYVRLQHGIHTGLSMHTENGSLFLVTTIILSLQIIFGYLGYKVMKANSYFSTYLYGKEKSPGSYALICPGVAFVVFAFFFIHVGLVKNGILEKFSLIYFLLLIPIIYVQIKTIFTIFFLNKKLFNS